MSSCLEDSRRLIYNNSDELVSLTTVFRECGSIVEQRITSTRCSSVTAVTRALHIKPIYLDTNAAFTVKDHFNVQSVGRDSIEKIASRDILENIVKTKSTSVIAASKGFTDTINVSAMKLNVVIKRQSLTNPV